MTKKEVCLNNEAIAYYSGFGGLEIHAIEYGIEDYLYCASGAWYGNRTYHRLKIYYNEEGGYVRLYGHKIPLSECIRINNG